MPWLSFGTIAIGGLYAVKSHPAFDRAFVAAVHHSIVRAWLFSSMTPAIGHAAWLPPLLAAAGTVFVIPTAGEVPIVQTLQHAGLGGAGAAALVIGLVG